MYKYTHTYTYIHIVTYLYTFISIDTTLLWKKKMQVHRPLAI